MRCTAGVERRHQKAGSRRTSAPSTPSWGIDERIQTGGEADRVRPVPAIFDPFHWSFLRVRRLPAEADVLVVLEEVELTQKLSLTADDRVDAALKLLRQAPRVADRGRFDVDLLPGPIIADVFVALEEIEFTLVLAVSVESRVNALREGARQSPFAQRQREHVYG